MTSDLTASRVRALLERHDLRTRKSLGQHFLVDANTVRKIVRLAGLTPADTVLEVGPGIGTLTQALAGAARRVVAVELDEGVARALHEVVDGLDNVEVVIADAARSDLERLLGGRARLVANLPYGAATPILAHVLEDVPSVTGGLVMIQRELGERWIAGPGSKTYGSFSVKVAYHASAKVVADVPRTVFMPPPKVSSVLVAFERRPPAVDVRDARAFLRFVEQCFGQRRKTIRNSLAAAGLGRDAASAALELAGVDPSSRPEQLGIADFARLYEAAG